MVDKFTVRTEESNKFPVVAPPAGSDVYLTARLWDWWPVLELERGKTYRLHLTSMDYQHGFSLQPENINIQVLPGYEHVVTVQPNRSGTYAIVCNEFCGIGHHKMVGRIYVK
jgi:cytochrome c oxidase subunit 2